MAPKVFWNWKTAAAMTAGTPFGLIFGHRKTDMHPSVWLLPLSHTFGPTASNSFPLGVSVNVLKLSTNIFASLAAAAS